MRKFPPSRGLSVLMQQMTLFSVWIRNSPDSHPSRPVVVLLRCPLVVAGTKTCRFTVIVIVRDK